MTVTDIYEGINNSVGSYFEWAQAHPRHGLLVAAGLAAFWLVGLLRRWEWACRWQYYYKLWMFDACKPETKRKIQIALVSLVLILILVWYFMWV